MVFYMTPDQEWALEQLGDLEGKCVLEVGAGIGINAMYLASRGAVVIATDIAADRLAILKAIATQTLGAEVAARIIAVKCAAEALPFRDGSFHRAYTKSVIIHTRIPDAASELSRTMKPDGRGVFIEPLTRNPFVNLYRATLAPKIWREITTYFTQREVEIVTKPFASSKTRYFYWVSFAAFALQFGVRAPALFRAVLRPLWGFDRWLFRVFPRLARDAWFVAIAVRR